MLIDSDLDDRVATLESKICSAKQREADPMLEVNLDSALGISVEGLDVALGVPDVTGSELQKNVGEHASFTASPSGNFASSSNQIRTFFTQHTANSLLKQRKSSHRLVDLLQPLPEHYTFEQSTFDLSMFLGSGHLGLFGTFQTIALLLLTMLMQAVFIGIGLMNFLEPAVTEATVEEALTWRRSSAHSLTEFDSVVGKSLGERVCSGDRSLHISGIQISLYEEISKYLYPAGADSFTTFFNGQTLCIVALLCWYMMVAREIGQALALHRGMVSTPNGSTRIEGRENPFTQALHFKLEHVSCGRKCISYALLTYRFVAAGLLLYVGSYFLVYTVNVTELILNAVSLSIILDIDNYIFGALASTSGKDLIHYLQPLQVPPYARLKGTDVKSAIMCIAVPGLTLLVLLTMLFPMTEQLSRVSQAMCYGDVSFVWTMDKRGLTLLSSTNSSGAQVLAKTDAIDQAGGFAPGPYVEYGLWVKDMEEMQYLASLTLEKQIEAGNPNCGDLAENGTQMLNYLRDSLDDWNINSCADAQHYCHSITSMPGFGIDGGKGFMTRLLCSETCGCADPGGEFIFVQGCPYDTKQCITSEPYIEKLQQGSCTEKNASELRNFSHWTSWVNDLRRYADTPEIDQRKRMEVKILAEAMWEHGCDFKDYMGNVTWGDCFFWGPLFDFGFKTVAFFCPDNCGCEVERVEEQDNRCPIPEGIGCAELRGPGGGGGGGDDDDDDDDGRGPGRGR